MDAVTLANSARTDTNPPAGLSPTLNTLWLAGAGQWDAAHDACQDLPEPAGAWIHAWLHREEGDYGNACYWYSRANKPAPSRNDPLEDEWMQIARSLIH